jgi:hypothetical protein
MPKNLGQKGLTKVMKIYVKIPPNFVSKGQMDVKGGNMMLKRVNRINAGFSKTLPAFFGCASYFQNWCVEEALRRCAAGRWGVGRWRQAGLWHG